MGLHVLRSASLLWHTEEWCSGFWEAVEETLREESANTLFSKLNLENPKKNIKKTITYFSVFLYSLKVSEVYAVFVAPNLSTLTADSLLLIHSLAVWDRNQENLDLFPVAAVSRFIKGALSLNSDFSNRSVLTSLRILSWLSFISKRFPRLCWLDKLPSLIYRSFRFLCNTYRFLLQELITWHSIDDRPL